MLQRSVIGRFRYLLPLCLIISQIGAPAQSGFTTPIPSAVIRKAVKFTSKNLIGKLAASRSPPPLPPLHPITLTVTDAFSSKEYRFPEDSTII